jgi:hypothetical protein
LHIASRLGNDIGIRMLVSLDPSVLRVRNYKDRLPLFILVKHFATPLWETHGGPVCIGGYHTDNLFEDLVRLFLKHYPEAAGIATGSGDTPLSAAISTFRGDSVKRLLLRAAPHLDTPELHRMNYSQRRGVLFLMFIVGSKSPIAVGLTKLYVQDSDALYHVASFI